MGFLHNPLQKGFAWGLCANPMWKETCMGLHTSPMNRTYRGLCMEVACNPLWKVSLHASLSKKCQERELTLGKENFSSAASVRFLSEQKTKVMFANCHPHGVEQGVWGVMFQNTFAGNCMKFFDLQRKVMYANHHPHGEGWGSSSKRFLWGIVWNVLMCAENSCLPTTTNWEWVGQGSS